MSQTSFQRVFSALEHKEPDRIPIDLGGTAVTGINIQALRKPKDYLDIHVLQAGVPPENIVAWWETWRQYANC